MVTWHTTLFSFLSDSGKMVEEKRDLFILDDLDSARKFWQRKEDSFKTSLHDCLNETVSSFLDRRPENAIGVFEDFFSEIRSPPKTKHEVQDQENTKETELKLLTASILTQKLFEKDADKEGELETDEEVETPLPNLMNLNFYFEQAGIGLPHEEMFNVWLSLKTLVDSKPLQTVRFWGKIFGLEHNYYIAEVEYRDGGLEEEEELEREEREEDEEDSKDKEEENENDDDRDEEEDDLPKSTWVAPPVIPKEDYKSGANKHVYFVTNTFCGSWIKLPHVSPAEINAARQIKKFFTGRIDAPVVSYPPFPGNEANYLRAQIARITAGTHISPAGYYAFEDEEEEEEEEVRETYVVNPEFEGVSPRELLDTTANTWVHHCLNILPQGRCIWHNPVTRNEDDFEEEEPDDEEEGDEEIMPETGPPLLSSISEDDGIENNPAWSSYLSSNFLPQYAIAVMRSNRWPGAYAFAQEMKFENIYIGWGQKYMPKGYTPPVLPPVLDEYPTGADVIEIADPTVEEEKEAKSKTEDDLEPGDEEEDIDDEDDDD